MATNAQRSHMQSIMHWMIDHHSAVGYNQLRPMKNIGLFEQEFESKVGTGWTTSMDCSEFVTLLCKWSGYQDPSGMHYTGYGNSMTMYDALGHSFDASRARIGQIVVFGPGGAQHAAVVMEYGTDPLLCSHGSSRGPIAIRLSIMKQSLGNPAVTFLTVSGL